MGKWRVILQPLHELMKHGIQRVRQFGKRLFFARRGENPLSDIACIDLEITTFCNLACRCCPRKSLVNSGESLDLKGLRKAYEFFPFFPNLKTIQLVGLGEATLHPQLAKVVEYLSGTGKQLTLITNGIMATPAFMKDLLGSFASVRVSLDAATPETYEKVRQGASFSPLIKNLSGLISLRNELRLKTKIGISFIGNSANVEEIPEFLKLAQSIGADFAYFENANAPWHMDDVLSQMQANIEKSRKWFLGEIQLQTTKTGERKVAVDCAYLRSIFKIGVDLFPRICPFISQSPFPKRVGDYQLEELVRERRKLIHQVEKGCYSECKGCNQNMSQAHLAGH